MSWIYVTEGPVAGSSELSIKGTAFVSDLTFLD